MARHTRIQHDHTRHNHMIRLNYSLEFRIFHAILAVGKQLFQKERRRILKKAGNSIPTPVRLVLDAADADVERLSSDKPHPNLVTLVRALARQAAREFLEGETAKRRRDRLSD